MTELELRQFFSNGGLVDPHAQFTKFSGGLHNSVWRVDTEDFSLVAKEFTTSTDGALFPNLPEKEAEALRRLEGLDIAPKLIGFWPEVKLLVYEYVEGAMWDGDIAGVAHLLLRKEVADPMGFRRVALQYENIIAEGDVFFERCQNKPNSPRPQHMEIPVPEKLSLIHTDVGVNLVGSGVGLRLIDWQCPAIGDICEDIYSFLSPAFQILGERAPLVEKQIISFWEALDRPDLADRYSKLRSAFAWRFACYCAWRTEILDNVDICARYQLALNAELKYLSEHL